jgi:hypothetical protein
LRHEAILLASPLNLLERIGAIERRLVPIERLIDRALSMSTSSPEQLGPLKDRLAQELTEQMSRFATNGAVVEIIESQALIARRGKRTRFAGYEHKTHADLEAAVSQMVTQLASDHSGLRGDLSAPRRQPCAGNRTRSLDQ